MPPAYSDRLAISNHSHHQFAALFRFVQSITGLIDTFPARAKLAGTALPSAGVKRQKPAVQCASNHDVLDPRAHRIALSAARTRHIWKQHPELRNRGIRLLDTIAQPTAIYRDAMFANRAAYYKPISSDEHPPCFSRVVVDMHPNGGGEVRTAFLVNDRTRGEQQLWP